MNKEISISLFRVSSDSLYLDFVFSCPEEYYFDSLQLEARYFEKGVLKTQTFDLSPALFTVIGPNSTIYNKHWTVRIPITKLNGIPVNNGVPVPAIYICTLNASKIIRRCSEYIEDEASYNYYKNCFGDWVITNGELNLDLHYDPEVDKIYSTEGLEVTEGTKNGEGRLWHFVNDAGMVEDSNSPIMIECDRCEREYNEDYLQDTAVASDVCFVYKCMLDDLLMKEGKCEDLISDDIIRNYLLLYGHTASLAAHDLETSQEYFKLVSNCFEKCSHSRGTGSCCSGNCGDSTRKINNSSCNCGR